MGSQVVDTRDAPVGQVIARVVKWSLGWLSRYCYLCNKWLSGHWGGQVDTTVSAMNGQAVAKVVKWVKTGVRGGVKLVTGVVKKVWTGMLRVVKRVKTGVIRVAKWVKTEVIRVAKWVRTGVRGELIWLLG